MMDEVFRDFVWLKIVNDIRKVLNLKSRGSSSGKCKIQSSSPPSVLMESQVMSRSPQIISGASQQNRVAAFSLTTAAAGDSIWGFYRDTKRAAWSHFIFGTMLQCSFTVKLQKCTNLNANLLSWRWADNDLIFTFGWPFPLMVKYLSLRQECGSLLH